MGYSSHQLFYKDNESYSSFLASQQLGLFTKYADFLRPDSTEGLILDVGCGVGQVVAMLIEKGYKAIGIEVSESSVRKAQQLGLPCYLYDGYKIPYPDNQFDRVGAFNVLEHVEEPEAFIFELVRVLKPEGKLVLSSPNFLRVIGLFDYHNHMRGIKNKIRNLIRLIVKFYQIKRSPDSVRFDRMKPIWKEPFEPDDDALIATNLLEMSFFVRKAGCIIERAECTDRYVPKWLDFILNVSPLRYIMLNAFIVARKSHESEL